jgi:signal transduction histidine kinase
MTRRLILSYLIVTVFVLLILEIPLGLFFQQREQDRLTADAERDATVLASIYEDALEKDTIPDPVPATDYSRDTTARVVIVDDQGISLVDTGAKVDRDLSTRPEFEIALGGRRSTGIRHSNTLNTDLLYVAVPVASGGTVHGAVRITLDTHELAERVRRFWIGLAGVAVVVLIAVAAVGKTLASSVTRPIRHLQSTAARFAGGDLTQTVPDSTSAPEIISLEEAMNTMAHRLDRLLEQQRRFVSDSSHQLRTPLTALRLRLENLQSTIEDPTQVEELDLAVEEITRLSELVTNLLHLAKADQPQEAAASDLARLTKDRADTWTAIADEADVTIETVLPDHGVWVSSVPGGVEQILDNLLDNAMSASPPGATITATISEGGDQHVLSVSDNGPGLDDASKRRAIERFWRADASKPGTGLGLAIIKGLVDASHGELTLTDNVPTGLIVTVGFVAAGPPTFEPATTAGQDRRRQE